MSSTDASRASMFGKVRSSMFSRKSIDYQTLDSLEKGSVFGKPTADEEGERADDPDDDDFAKKPKPRTLFQKFLFALITLLEVFIVYITYKGIDFGIPALATTGGPILLNITILICASCALSVLSFFFTCILEPGTELYSNIVLGVDSSNVAVQTSLINALATSSWGASGDVITLLKYLIQYQILINYVNVGFSFAFAEHIKIGKLPDFMHTISEYIEKIDEYFNSLIEPLCDCFAWIVMTLYCPFRTIGHGIYGAVAYVLSPMKYCLAYAVVSIASFIEKIYEFIALIFSSIFFVICLIFSYIGIALFFIRDCIGYVWDLLIVTPIVFVCGLFACLPCCRRAALRFPQRIYGWFEKKGKIFWNKRFYTIDRGILSYYISAIGNPPIGDQIKGKKDLGRYFMAVKSVENDPSRPFDIEVIPAIEDGTNFRLRCRTEAEMDALAIALNEHIQYYSRKGFY